MLLCRRLRATGHLLRVGKISISLCMFRFGPGECSYQHWIDCMKKCNIELAAWEGISSGSIRKSFSLAELFQASNWRWFYWIRNCRVDYAAYGISKCFFFSKLARQTTRSVNSIHPTQIEVVIMNWCPAIQIHNNHHKQNARLNIEMFFHIIEYKNK